MKKIITSVVLLGSISTFAMDSFVLCSEGLSAVEATKELNTKLNITIIKSDIARIDETPAFLDPSDYNVSAPVLNSNSGKTEVCVTLSKK